jgi:hypothetical protein
MRPAAFGTPEPDGKRRDAQPGANQDPEHRAAAAKHATMHKLQKSAVTLR